MLNREQRRKVAEETQKLSASIIESTPGAASDSTLYKTLLPSPAAVSNQAKIQVQNADTFTAAQRIIRELPNAKVGVLNMASEKNPGGGWLGGSLAQEEALCYRSTLAATLNQDYYPLSPLGAIWSPAVAVFRDEVRNDCKIYSNVMDRFVVGVVSVAGLRRPKTTKDGEDFADAGDVKLLEDKIRQILRVLASNGITHCVLGALGCGAFENPPKRVAAAFRKVMKDEEECQGLFEGVYFAVLDVSRGEDNFRIFKAALDGIAV